MIEDGRLNFRGQILSPDGLKGYDVSRDGAVEHARDLGLAAAGEILNKADAALLVRSNV